jgi:hypothetical protein
LQNLVFAGTPLPGTLAVRDHIREIISISTFLHGGSNGCIDRFWPGLALERAIAALGRSFHRLPYRGLLPFPDEQNVGVPVQAERLYPATRTVLRCRRCELVDHPGDRAPLPVKFYHQCSHRQTVRTASGNPGGVSFDAALSVSESEQISS